MMKSTLTSLFLLFCVISVHAQYADLGTGIHKDKIWWFDWNGFTLANNASKTFTTADGIDVKIVFTNVASEPLFPSVMNTWQGAIIWRLYDFSNSFIQPALYGRETRINASFRMTITATRNGLPVPFTFVTVDAEASAPTESTTLTTNGSNWQTIDFFRNTSTSSNPVTGCNTNKVEVTNTFGGALGLGENPLLATTAPATGQIVVDFLMDKHGMPGAMGQAFGIFSPIDRGDLPASYGYVQHRLSFNPSNSCNYLAPLPTLAQDQRLLLGSVAGDADGAELTNDNAIGVDEDAFTSFPSYNKSGTYTLNVPLKNTTGSDAWLTGYFDSNNDGVFSAGEAVTARVAANATQASLQWTGIPATLSSSVNYAFRLRLSSDKAATERASGYAPDGEVEDYQAKLTYEVACNNWLYNSSASSGVRIGDLDITGNKITVEALINRTTAYTGGFKYAGNIVSKHTGSPDCNYLLRPNNAELTTTSGYVSTNPICEIELNKTYHVALVYDGAKLKFYRDGYLMSEVNCTGNLVNNDWSTLIGEIAVYPKTPQEAFIGYINEVRIWNIARTQDQIKTYMFSGLPDPATQTGLQAYYTFDNALNKQGNSTWNGYTEGSVVMQQNNPQCTFVADTCYVPVVAAAFSAPDTVCINTPVTITNASSNATSYFWNFCVANINSTPTGTNMGNIGGVISRPVFLDIAQEGTNYYGFLVNNTGSLVRLNYGNSLANTPTAVSLGTLDNTITDAEGVQVVKNEGKWYVFIVAGNPSAGVSSRIVKVELGTSITNNTPTVVNWGNIGSMYRPMELNMFKENGKWWGVTVNSENSTITRFSFGSSFDDVPTGVNLGNIGNLNHPGGLFSISDNGNWYVFVTNAASNTITRLEFGNSLLNIPAGVNLGNPGGVLVDPRDIYMVKFCDELVGFVPNGPASNSLIRLNFSSLLAAPTVTSLGNIANLSFAHSITPFYRVGADLFCFIPNADNSTLARVQITGCSNASLPNTTVQNPPAITYSAPGNYNINLMLDEGLSTQTSFCRRVTVLAPPTAVPVIDTTVCADSVVLLSRFTTESVWSDGSKLDSLVIKANGTYWVNTAFYGCEARDSFIYVMGGIGTMDIGNDTAFCRGGQMDVALSVPGATYQWQDGSTGNTFSISEAGKYKVTATNGFGCVAADSVIVKVIEFPVIQLMPDTTLCGPGAVALRTDALVYTDSIRWTPAPGITDIHNRDQFASPADTTLYILTAYNNFCARADTMIVNVNPLPVLGISRDTAICKGGIATLRVSGANTYEWKADPAITDVTLTNQTVMPASITRYYVKGTGMNGCYTNDSVQVDVVELPRLVLMQDTAICQTTSMQMRAADIQYTDSVRWVPATGLSSATNSSATATPLVTTNYRLTVYNRFCAAFDDITVTVKELPQVIISRDTTICRGDSLRLAASGAASYSWSPATDMTDATQASPVVKPQTTTAYQLTGTGSNGCTADRAVTVQVNEPLKFALSPAFVTVCEMDSFTMEASGADAYKWLMAGQDANTSTTATIVPQLPGSYAVVMYDYVCNRQDTMYSIVTVNALPQLVITKSNDIDCVLGEARLMVAGATRYQWYPAATLSGATLYNPVAKTDTSRMYYVTGTDMYGCTSSDSVLVRVLKNNANAYPIASAFTPNGDGLNDCFGVNKWGLIKNMQLVIYNRLGERVFVGNNPGDCWDGIYKNEKQLPGTYIYTIKAETLCGTISKKGTVVLIR